MKWNDRASKNRLATVLTGGLLLLPVGCGFFENAGTVSGSVYYKEQPLSEGSVSFFTEKGQTVTGAIDKSGRYVVAHVPVGPAKVTVQVFNAETPQMSFLDSPNAPQGVGKGNKVPLRYSMAATSGLQHSVTKGKQLFDLHLKE